MSKILQLFLLGLCTLLFSQCYSTKWNNITSHEGERKAPKAIQDLFASYPDSTVVIEAQCPAHSYQYDIGEKDEQYGKDSLKLLFNNVQIKLHPKMPAGKILADFSFKDRENNSVKVDGVDLLRLIPRLEGPDELVNIEMLEKEFNRFGYVFRKEHEEFEFVASEDNNPELQEAIDDTYRCKIVNNCLSPGKWEFELISEDYSDFGSRKKSNTNLNQNKIIAHSWFLLEKPLYEALYKIKNPDKKLI